MPRKIQPSSRPRPKRKPGAKRKPKTGGAPRKKTTGKSSRKSPQPKARGRSPGEKSAHQIGKSSANRRQEPRKPKPPAEVPETFRPGLTAKGNPCRFCLAHRRLCAYHAPRAATQVGDQIRAGVAVAAEFDPKNFSFESLEDVSRLYNFAMANWLTGHIKTYELGAVAKFGAEIRTQLEASGATLPSQYEFSSELLDREGVRRLAVAWGLLPDTDEVGGDE